MPLDPHHLSSLCMERTREIALLVLSRCWHGRLFPFLHPAITNTRVEVDIRLVDIEYGVVYACCLQCPVYCPHFLLFFRVTDAKCRPCPIPYHPQLRQQSP